MRKTTLRLGFVSVLSLAACDGGQPPALGPGDAPPLAETPAVEAGAPASPADAGISSSRRGLSAWMKQGIVQDFNAARGRGDHSWDTVAIGDSLKIDVGYGIDILDLRQSAEVGPAWDRFQGDPADCLIIGGSSGPTEDPAGVPYTGPWLAKQIYDAMTAVPTMPKGDKTVRESPGGRVHCERADSKPWRTDFCYLRGFEKVFF